MLQRSTAAWREARGNGKVGCHGKCPLRAAAVFGSKFQCCQSTGGSGIRCGTGVTAGVFACWVLSPVLPLKYKNPGQSAAYFPHPFTFLRLDPYTGSVLALCGTVLVAGGYREAEVHLQPMEEPALE